MRPFLQVGAKLAATMAIVGVIGAAVVYSGAPEAPVQEADADIFSMSFAPKSKHQRFLDVLDEQGLDEHRTYDYNGNRMGFAVTQTDEKPLEVMRRFQRAFVRKGLNKKDWSRSLAPIHKAGLTIEQIKDPKIPAATKRARVDLLLKHKERLDDFVGGGLVPFQVSPKYVSMIGATTKKGAKDSLDYFDEAVRGLAKGKDLREVGKGMHFVEAMYNPKTRKTTVTATWNKKPLDHDAFHGKPKVSVNEQMKLPVCAGCKRTQYVAGVEDDMKFQTFVGTASPNQSLAFYERTLHARGWKQSAVTNMVRAAQLGHNIDKRAHLKSFERNGRFLTVISYPTKNGEVRTHVMESR